VNKEKFYAGVGSRKTPERILGGMAAAAQALAQEGWIVRSGGAKGADSAFQTGSPAHRQEIYRPMPEQNYPKALWEQAMVIASQTHPAWHACSDYAKALHTRNVFQVLGSTLDKPSRFVLCWTPDGAEYGHETSRKTGGTGTAIRIADRFGIPVFNVARPETAERIDRWLNV